MAESGKYKLDESMFDQNLWFILYPEVAAILHMLLAEVRAILGDQFIGMYVYGSLAYGGFDRDSDIDFVVFTRDLYTLEFGTIASKPVAARWAQMTFGEPWVALIERAWAGRYNPGAKALPEDIDETLAFIRFTLEHSRSSRQ